MSVCAMTSDNVGSAISCVTDTLANTLVSKQSVLIDEGQGLALIFLAITLAWALLQFILTSDGAQTIAQVMNTAARYCFVLVLLTGWSSTVGDFFNTNMNAVARKLSGQDTSERALNAMFQAMKKMVMPDDPTGSAPSYEDLRECDSLGDSTAAAYCAMGSRPPGANANSTSSVSVWDVFFWFPKLLIKVVIKIFALVFLLAMMIFYSLAIMAAQVMFSIGMCIGPILVPGLIWKHTEFLFNGFLRFMLKASMVKLVAALLVAGVGGVVVAIESLAPLVDQGGIGFGNVDLLAAMVVCWVCAMGAYLMHKVESIASELTSGHGTSVSGAGLANSAQHLAHSAQQFTRR